MRVLENCEPKQVSYYFEEICKIPHGSRNTKQISDYLVAFAKEHGFDYVQDEMNNVIIYKPATPGYENAPSPCRINNAGTGYQNPAPALLIVIILL